MFCEKCSYRWLFGSQITPERFNPRLRPSPPPSCLMPSSPIIPSPSLLPPSLYLATPPASRAIPGTGGGVQAQCSSTCQQPDAALIGDRLPCGENRQAEEEGAEREGGEGEGAERGREGERGMEGDSRGALVPRAPLLSPSIQSQSALQPDTSLRTSTQCWRAEWHHDQPPRIHEQKNSKYRTDEFDTSNKLKF